MVRDWQNAVVVPIPKKGDLKQCYNWHGIIFFGCGREGTR